MVVGFYVHTDMNFVVTERKDEAEGADGKAGEYDAALQFEVAALPGAPEE
jgi:hypothetical protein